MPPILLVTGGSRGIGAATALLAAQRGYRVALSYHTDEAAALAVAERIRSGGGEALTLRCDVSQEADVLNLFQAVDAAWGPLNALVNNAGVVDRAQRVDELSAERLHRMFATNAIGSLLCAREAVRRMSTRHGGLGGAIVNVSSIAARLGSAHQYVDYAASKAAVDTFTVGLAHEVAAEGVRVNAVRPGIIDTDIHASGGQPDRAWRLAPTVPMQRPGKAEEVAACILWLLSDEAGYVTGSLYDVSGGR
jgi:NAD(P)-dependent dehydrogenase (short-subunit alcohol dehydrogenase family)